MLTWLMNAVWSTYMTAAWLDKYYFQIKQNLYSQQAPAYFLIWGVPQRVSMQPFNDM